MIDRNIDFMKFIEKHKDKNAISLIANSLYVYRCKKLKIDPIQKLNSIHFTIKATIYRQAYYQWLSYCLVKNIIKNGEVNERFENLIKDTGNDMRYYIDEAIAVIPYWFSQKHNLRTRERD